MRKVAPISRQEGEFSAELHKAPGGVETQLHPVLEFYVSSEKGATTPPYLPVYLPRG
jgi:hypothetical protein